MSSPIFARSGFMAPLSAQVTGKSWLGAHGDGGNGSWSTPENRNPAGGNGAATTTNDQIDFAPAGGILTGNVKLDLVFENGYTPGSGGSWTLFTGETGDITATFDLSQPAPLLRDTDQFTRQGGWKLVLLS